MTSAANRPASQAPRARDSRNRFALSADRLAYAILFILLALVAVQCARLGLAGLLVQRAQAETERWAITARAPEKAEVRRVSSLLADSLDYVSDNPWSLEGLGALYLTRMRLSTNAREALALTRDARVRFLQAIQRRPTSPFLWANLALSKLYLAEFDEEMMNALRRADELGPWEPVVQQTMVFVGLAAWQKLDAGLQRDMGAAIARGAQRNPEKMYKIAKSYTRFDLVCAIEEYRRIAGTDCAGIGLSSGKSGSSK